MTDIDNIKQLLDKYFNADTSKEDERVLSAYFNQSDIDEDLLAYAVLFRNFKDEQKIKAPANAADILKSVQKQEKGNRISRIFYISAVAAGFIILLTIGILNQNVENNNGFIMYSNGVRIDDPVAAMEYTAQQFEKISATFGKANSIIEKPINTIEQSLSPLKKTKAQFDKAESLFSFSKNE